MCRHSADVAAKPPACFPRSNQLSLASERPPVERREERRKPRRFGSYAAANPGKQRGCVLWMTALSKSMERSHPLLSCFQPPSVSLSVDEQVEDAFPHKEDEQTKLWRLCSHRAGADCSLRQLIKSPLERATCHAPINVVCVTKLVFDFVRFIPSRKPQLKERTTFCLWHISLIVSIPNNCNFECLKSHWIFCGANSSPYYVWSFMWSTGANVLEASI